MKCTESWLREWVDPKITREKLHSDLTMAGFEVEEMALVQDTELASLVSTDTQQDYIMDVAITPNRGDCLSVRGLAREIAAITKTPIRKASASWHPEMPAHTWVAVDPDMADKKGRIPIHVMSELGCPRYIGRMIRDIKIDQSTPTWIKDRLISSGLKVINPVVDVTNYVMLELGQPMHAFDLQTIKNEIHIRLSKKGEQITLLDHSVKELDADTLIIADIDKPLAIAGVMGGLDSGVSSQTTDIFLESAFFTPATIARQRQYYGLHSDSAYRFERGVDPAIQHQAIERATQLILDIVGGHPGPVIEVESKTFTPKQTDISLTSEKLNQLLGMSIPDEEVEAIFKALCFSFTKTKDRWTVQIPSYRFDLAIAEDLIEEIARLYGYNNIPTHSIHGQLAINHVPDMAPDLRHIRQALCDQGYHEIISYSFVDKKLQTLLDTETPCELLNPMTNDMNVMRTNLWPGLIGSFLYNKSRQQHRVRLFEIGTCFMMRDQKLQQLPRIAGLISGLCFPEQWGAPSREVDFYDIKGDVENILSLSSSKDDWIFKNEPHSALHPGQSAAIYHHNQKVGMVGALHPGALQTLGETEKVFVFELDLEWMRLPFAGRFQEISKFPEIRRDIAILVKQTIPAKEIQDTIKSVAGNWLKDVFIFDVYQGKGISPGLKSIALALILQHPTRTLVDDEVAELMNRVITSLKGQFGAELRS